LGKGPRPTCESDWGVPGERPRRLRAEDGVLEAVIHHGVGARGGARVPGEPLELAREGAPQAEIDGVVPVAAGVPQLVGGAVEEGGIELRGGRHEHQPAAPRAPRVSGLDIELMRQLALDGEAGGAVVGHFQGLLVHLEGGLDGAMHNSARQEERRKADLVLLARDGAEADGVVVDAPTGGELGIAQAVRRPRRRKARRHLEVADNLVPFRAHAGFQHQSFTRRPVVLDVLRGLEILAGLKGTAREGNVAGHGTVVAQDFVVVADDLLVKRLPLEVDPEFQLVRARQMQRGQEKVAIHCCRYEWRSVPTK